MSDPAGGCRESFSDTVKPVASARLISYQVGMSHGGEERSRRGIDDLSALHGPEVGF